jgi:hypothetical protein
MEVEFSARGSGSVDDSKFWGYLVECRLLFFVLSYFHILSTQASTALFVGDTSRSIAFLYLTLHYENLSTTIQALARYKTKEVAQ